MVTPIRVLIIEDSLEDTELLLGELRHGGYDPTTYDRVQTAQAMTAALNRQSWDIVFCDYTMPHFSGMDALHLVRERGLDLPFIFVSGTIGEDIAVAAMKAGANDYIMKGDTKRLLPAVERELRESEVRQEGKRAQEQLRQSEERFQQIAENIQEVFWIASADFKQIIYISPAYEKIWGRTCQSLYDAPHSWLDAIHSEDLDRDRIRNSGPADLSLADSKIGQVEEEYRIVRPDGTIRWIRDRVFPIKDGSGRVYRITGIAEDITERKRAEEALKLFRALIDRSNDAIEVVDPETGRFLDINEKAWQDLGYSREELLSLRVSDIDPTVDPSSFTRVMEELRKSGFILWEGYHRRKDGSTFPVEVNIKYVQLDRGYVVTVVRDITERKKAEGQLRLQSAALESAANAIVITNREGKIIWANSAFTRNTGHTLEEARGQNLRLLKSGLQSHSFYEHLWKTILSGQVWQDEIINRRKDGGLYTEEMTITPVRNEHGEISHFIAIKQDITERKQMEKIVQRMAFYDSLTDLPNRNMLHDCLLNAIRSDSGEGKPMALLLMDLDHFKEINDTLGHHRGDLLLKEVGVRLKSVLFEPDVVARLGGDEFAILLPKLASPDDINLVIQKIITALEAPFMIESLPIAVEVSIGVVLYPDHGENPESLMQRADVAMYKAKETGSGYVIYDIKYDKHSPRRLALIGELRRAIEKDQLFLHYQPKISFKTNRVIGVEALVRWQHPEYGFVPPDQFILPAEQTGLIHPLTRWVLKTALRQSQAWRQAGLNLPVSVNLSARNLHDPQFPDHLAELLKTTGGMPEQLELEITESAIMADPQRALEVITHLRTMGLRFALDDFGIGYSSLAYLKKLPVDSIKIDKSFVIDMAKDEDDVVIVLSTISLAHNLGLKVVAEGVETEKILDQLSAFGCDEAQGYYMSKPLPVDALTRWLKESPWGLKQA